MTEAAGRVGSQHLKLILDSTNPNSTQVASKVESSPSNGSDYQPPLSTPAMTSAHPHIRQIYPDPRQKARTQVLEEIVRNTLENPSHPYYSIGAKEREEMRRAIVELLEPSHYLNPSRIASK